MIQMKAAVLSLMVLFIPTLRASQVMVRPSADCSDLLTLVGISDDRQISQRWLALKEAYVQNDPNGILDAHLRQLVHRILERVNRLSAPAPDFRWQVEALKARITKIGQDFRESPEPLDYVAVYSWVAKAAPLLVEHGTGPAQPERLPMWRHQIELLIGEAGTVSEEHRAILESPELGSAAVQELEQMVIARAPLQFFFLTEEEVPVAVTNSLMSFGIHLVSIGHDPIYPRRDVSNDWQRIKFGLLRAIKFFDTDQHLKGGLDHDPRYVSSVLRERGEFLARYRDRVRAHERDLAELVWYAIFYHRPGPRGSIEPHPALVRRFCANNPILSWQLVADNVVAALDPKSLSEENINEMILAICASARNEPIPTTPEPWSFFSLFRRPQ